MGIQANARAVWASKPARVFYDLLKDVLQRALIWLRSDRHLARRDVFVIIAVIVLHAIFFAIIVWGMHPSGAPPIPGELHVAFYDPRQIVDRPLAVPPPNVPVTQPPDIVIANDTATTEILAVAPSSILAPRSDPSHPNPVPSSANLGIAIGAQATLILRLTISAEGTVLQAIVVQSSGQDALDAGIENFVKKKWRFLPATLNGNPIQYPTTTAINVGAGDQ